MIVLIRLALAIVASLFKPRARLEAENVSLRQQLIVLRRKLPGRVGLTNGDRLFFGWLHRLFPSIAGAMLLPQQAVTRGPQGDTVLVVGEGGTVAPRPVRSGGAAGSQWIVLEGLKPGDKVVQRPPKEIK